VYELPATWMILNPLPVLYTLIAIAVFGGGWVARKVRKQPPSE
jgi:hypothetical protein